MVDSEDLNRPMIRLHVFSLWALAKGILSYSRIYKAFDPFKLSSEATLPLDGLLTDGYRLDVEQVPVVQTLDSAIQWINHYPLDNSIGFASVYPLDSDLSGGQRYPSFEQLGPGW